MSARRWWHVLVVCSFAVGVQGILAQPTVPTATRSPRAEAVDASARALLLRARAARLQQDSALRSYDVTSYQRITIGLSVRGTGLERRMFHEDNVARVRWQRGTGVHVESIGSRSSGAFAEEGSEGTGADYAAIPYFPGREALWFPAPDMAVTRAEMDGTTFVHPLVAGSEAYYRYALGDATSIRLPDGTAIGLRELRITPRRADPRLYVGSFWFDTASAQLVRASYRVSRTLDVWPLMQRVERALRDSLTRRRDGARDAEAREAAERELATIDEVPPTWAQRVMQPFEVALDAITVEYALYNGRFWLPKAHSAQGSAQAMFLRAPMRFDERFVYASVDGDVGPIARMTLDTLDDVFPQGVIRVGRADGAPDSTFTRLFYTREEIDGLSAASDSLARQSEQAGDTLGARLIRERAARRRQRLESVLAQCRTDSTYEQPSTRYGGALRYVTRRPCDTRQLTTSDAVPVDADSVERLFADAAHEALRGALDLSLQPGWSPQRPRIRTGLDLARFNRVEGLSVGVAATSALGAGLEVRGTARLGTGDWVPNAEVQLTRSNGRRTVGAAVFTRLSAANEEFGSPLSLGASLASLLYGRDEGFYFRRAGAEAVATMHGGRSATGGGATTHRLRLFAEHQWSTGAPTDVVTRWSFARVARPATRFLPNIDAARLDLVGVEYAARRTYGTDPDRWRAVTAVALEGATGTQSFARGMLDLGVGRRVGVVQTAVTGYLGSSVGAIPIQRTFFVGGARTVRGQSAGTQQGSAFWVTRAEVGLAAQGLRPVAFIDVGWAGDRRDLWRPARSGRAGYPQRGAGLGLSAWDGLFRVDVARGIAPRRQWRVDLYLDARL
ncbi:MAG: outer membrane protein assembly factor [Gemmatimonadaceae bacterium]|nr:outer membrane protein assembly factor [Gemmatimonadaceae bacterium]